MVTGVSGESPRSERFFEALVGAAPVATLVLDATGGITYASPAATGLLGYDTECLVGRNIVEILAPGSVALAMQAMAAMHDDEGRRPAWMGPPIRLRVRHADGSWGIYGTGASNRYRDPDVGGFIVRLTPACHEQRLEEYLDSLGVAASLHEQLQRLVGWVEAGIPESVVTIGLDWTGDHFEQVISRTDLDPAMTGSRPTVGPSPWGHALDAGAFTVLADLDGDTDLADETVAVAMNAGLRTCWIQPIRTRSNVSAAITVWHPISGPPPTQNEALLRRVARLAAITLENHRDRRRLEEAATVDSLTGVLSRAALFTALDDLDRQPATVLYLDLDGFKAVNDEHGHAVGDEVLADLGVRLASAVRPGDLVGRVGGDEFVVLCPGLTDPAVAGQIGDRLLDALAVPYETAAGHLTIGASAGVNISQGDTRPDELLLGADRALYAAKASGKGCWFYANTTAC